MNGNPHPATHRAVAADGRYGEAGTVYRGGLLQASGGAATVKVYDGIDTAGTLIDSFDVAADGDVARTAVDDGVIIRVALYVDVGSNVGKFTLFLDVAQVREG